MKNIALGILLSSTAAVAATDVKVSGFADVGFTHGVQNRGNNGFALNDGAIYINGKSGASEVRIDAPLSADGQFLGGKFQAYVAHSYENGFSWKLGQFDTPIGLELNDTADVVLTTQGIVYGFNPTVERGFQAAYKMGDFNFIAQVSHPGASSALNGNNYNYSAQVAYTADFTAALSATYNKAGTEAGMYYNLVVGKKFDALALNAEVSMKDNNEQAGNKDASLAYGLHAGYQFDDALNGAVRAEMISKATAHSVTQVTVGPQYKMTEALTLKADYTYVSTVATVGADAAVSSKIAIAAVHRF